MYHLNARINIEGLLTFGAVSAFHNSPDDLFGKDKNYYVVDYSSSELGKRESSWGSPTVWERRHSFQPRPR